MMNKTLNECARSMRLHAELPKNFWVEVVCTVVYLINRGPLAPLKCRISEEVCNGRKVNLSFLKVFGYVSYIHIDFVVRSKLNPKFVKCFFIGYGDTKFVYHLWDDQNCKIIRSRDVIFSEQVMCKDRLSIKYESVCSEVKNPLIVESKDFLMNGL